MQFQEIFRSSETIERAIHRFSAVRIGIEDKPNTTFAKQAAGKSGWIGIVKPASRNSPGVHLGNLARRRNGISSGDQLVPIPFCIFVEIRMLHVELPYQVEMPCDIEIAMCHHLALLTKIGTYERLRRTAEMLAYAFFKQLRIMVDRYATAIGSDNEMY